MGARGVADVEAGLAALLASPGCTADAGHGLAHVQSVLRHVDAAILQSGVLQTS